MTPLTAAITAAVNEFSDNHQSLRQLMINTLVTIVEQHVNKAQAPVRRAVGRVLQFDWSSSDDDAAHAIEMLRREREKQIMSVVGGVDA